MKFELTVSGYPEKRIAAEQLEISVKDIPNSAFIGANYKCTECYAIFDANKNFAKFIENGKLVSICNMDTIEAVTWIERCDEYDCFYIKSNKQLLCFDVVESIKTQGDYFFVTVTELDHYDYEDNRTSTIILKEEKGGEVNIIHELKQIYSSRERTISLSSISENPELLEAVESAIRRTIEQFDKEV